MRARVMASARLVIVCLLSVVYSTVVAQQLESVLAPLAEKSLIFDIARAGERLVAVGERGHVLLSDDAGAQWRQVIVPTRSTLTSVFFADAQIGFAVGHDAVILRSKDAGETWQLVYSDAQEESPLLDVFFFSERRGVAVGAYAYFLVTDDSGDSWEPLAINDEDDFHLNAIVPAPDGDLFIAAEAGFIYRSIDAAVSWESLESPYEGSFFGALSDTDGELLVFGLRGNLYRSHNAGEDWENIELGTKAMLTDATRLPDGRVVIVGLEGMVLIETEASYKEFQLPDRSGLTAVVAIDGETLVLAGDAGLLRVPLDALRSKGESQ